MIDYILFLIGLCVIAKCAVSAFRYVRRERAVAFLLGYGIDLEDALDHPDPDVQLESALKLISLIERTR